MWTLKAHTSALQSTAQTNQWSPSRSSLFNNKYVAAPPSQTNSCMAGALTVFVLPYDVQVGHNVCHRHSPCPWLTDLIVVQLVVKPRKNVLVAQAIPQQEAWFHRRASDTLASEVATTKSEVAASPLPSRGPTRGRKCYITPCILGGP